MRNAINPNATIITYPTTANLGPLFDIAGARLDGRKSGLVMITEAHFKEEPGLVIYSKGQYAVPTHEGENGNLAYKIAKKMFEDKKLLGGFILTFSNEMKPGGLGTSGAGAVAVVEAVNQIYKLGLTDKEKIAYARLGEPGEHLDNVVPGVLGGIVVSSKYTSLPIPKSIVPLLVVPQDLEKDGGTEKARKPLDEMVAGNRDFVTITDLAAQMIAGISQDDFGLVRDSIMEYSRWGKSVTSIRNRGDVYRVDVNELNTQLEKRFGNEAVATPSGAGPAMLILSPDNAIAMRARNEAEKIYRETFRSSAKAFDTPFY